MRSKKTPQDEAARLYAMMAYERAARGLGYRLIAGVDEAGRGPLAGPVVSAALILPDGYSLVGLNDSKQLSAAAREKMYVRITEEAVAWGVGSCSQQEIDDINILNATKMSMARAVAQLSPQPDYLLIDALTVESIEIEQQAIIRGDALSLSIAAASVVAKVTRDRMMVDYDALYPGYGFAKHKGYGTKLHMEKIFEMGLCDLHRVSFCHIKDSGKDI